MRPRRYTLCEQLRQISLPQLFGDQSARRPSYRKASGMVSCLYFVIGVV